MENINMILKHTAESEKETVKSVIKETFKELSLLTDSLIETAKAKTESREEFIAFMQGAAFLFYNVCERPKTFNKIEGHIDTVEEAIDHCKDLLPFMSLEAKGDHLKLIEWLEELIKLRKENK